MVEQPQTGAPAKPSSDPYLFQIRDLVYRVSGIFQPDERLLLFSERCARRMKERSAATFADYLEHLTARPDRDDEMRRLLAELISEEACFFSNPAQLEALSRVVLPSLLAEKKRAGDARLRLWSAGCATGEEPYTLAMTLLELSHGPLQGWSFEILATEMNERSLAKAEEGLFPESAMRLVTEPNRGRYFFPAEGYSAVSSDVRSKITFRRISLLDDSQRQHTREMDVIFCSNVLIYFDPAAKRRALQRFYNDLAPGGYLYIGHSESLYGVTNQFRLVHFPGATAYQKRAPFAVEVPSP